MYSRKWTMQNLITTLRTIIQTFQYSYCHLKVNIPVPSCWIHLAWKEAFQKSSFLLGFNVISNKNHLSYCYIVLRNEKVLRIEKIWKNTTKVHFNVLHCKSCRTKKSRLLVFWYKYIGNCQTVVFQFSRLWISRSLHGKRLFLLNPVVHRGGGGKFNPHPTPSGFF